MEQQLYPFPWSNPSQHLPPPPQRSRKDGNACYTSAQSSPHIPEHPLHSLQKSRGALERGSSRALHHGAQPLRRECGFAQALLSQWHKQAAKEVFLYALLECQGAQSPEGHSQEVPVGSQQHPQGEHQHRIPNSCWQPAPRQTILLGSALKGSGAFQCMVWHSLSSPSPDPTGLNRSKAPKSIWP